MMILSAAVAVFALLLAAAPGTALAAELEVLVQQLGAKDFAAKIEAVEQIAGSGDPRALPVLEAMLASRLAVRSSTGQVVITETHGSVLLLKDPLSQAEIEEVEKTRIDPVTVNNRLRGVLRGAVGGLTLLSPDAAKRREAADAVFKTRDASLLPLLEKAYDRETDAGVRSRIARALAATRAGAAETAEQRLASIGDLAGFPDPEVRSLLANVAAADSDAGVRAAAAVALKRVEQRLALWGVLGNVFQGVSLGSVLLLAAVGLAITFGVMGVINMAHGEMVMLGAYTTFVVQDLFQAHAPAASDFSLLVAIPAAFLFAGLVGIAIERGIIRFLYGRPLETLLATWGSA
jgi:urea transport system permease protein